jgi:hypothetical protein
LDEGIDGTRCQEPIVHCLPESSREEGAEVARIDLATFIGRAAVAAQYATSYLSFPDARFEIATEVVEGRWLFHAGTMQAARFSVSRRRGVR